MGIDTLYIDIIINYIWEDVHDPINLLFPILSLEFTFQSWEIQIVIYYITNTTIFESIKI